jgi:hypothetical protein
MPVTDTTLTAFLSEDDTATPFGAEAPAISLSDLKSRRVPVEWSEGVAIVQELCRALLEPGVDPERTPLGASDVFIDANGGVRFAQAAGEKGAPAIRRIGELLRTSLADSPFPVPLRLVITQATSTPPFYASIPELSNALEYFERPDRPGLVRAVYERAQEYQPVRDAVKQPAPQPEDEKPKRQDKQHRRRVPRGAVAACAVAGVVIVAVLVVAQLANRPYGRASGAHQPEKADAGALSGIVSSVGALVDRVNPFTTSPSSAAADPARDASNAPAESLRRSSAGASGRTRPAFPDASQPAADAVVLQVADVSSADTPPTTSVTDTIPAETAEMERTVDAGVEALIYSAKDDDVTPPVAEYPRLRASPPPGVHAGSLSTLELLVNETGDVESVRLREAPRHLAEALLVTVNLSAAKTWHFLPALKDGQPVRYRKLVQVWSTTR